MGWVHRRRKGRCMVSDRDRRERYRLRVQRRRNVGGGVVVGVVVGREARGCCKWWHARRVVERQRVQTERRNSGGSGHSRLGEHHLWHVLRGGHGVVTRLWTASLRALLGQAGKRIRLVRRREAGATQPVGCGHGRGVRKSKRIKNSQVCEKSNE